MKTGGEFLTTPVGKEPIFTRERFTDEQKEFLSLAVEFAKEEILPLKDEIEKHDEQLMRNLMRKMGEVGFLGIDVPEEYGGVSLDKVTSCILTESVSYGESASTNVTFSAHVTIGTLPIVFFGNAEQKQKYLPRLVSAEWISAYCLTEPTAGSDALAIRSTATPTEDGKYFILNGNKQFISNGGWADVYIVFARVNGEHFTAFIVERSWPGVTPGKEENKMGMRGSSTTAVNFENVKVPAENVLHEIGRGAEVAFNMLNIGRLKLGAADLGGCKVAINRAVEYALERWQFGRPIAHFDVIMGKFADMVIHAYALDSAVYRTAGWLDNSIEKVNPKSSSYYQEVADAIEQYAIECSICKVFGSESMWMVADNGVQIYGGYGFIEDYPMAKFLRDTRVDRIYEGTNEINRQIITGYFLKKTLLEQIPLRERLKELPRFLEGKVPKFNGPLAKEMTALEIAKMMTMHVYGLSLTQFGQDVLNEQQLSEQLSNMFINLYVMDSTISRVNQYLKDVGNDPVQVAIARVLSAEKTRQIADAAEMILHNMLQEPQLSRAIQEVKTLEAQMRLATNSFALKREIAEDLYKHKQYRFG